MAKVLGLNGSPRRDGNTELLLERFLKGAGSAGADADFIVLNELRFVPCQECDDLGDNARCVLEDDMQEVYRKVEGCDVLALASPIFFGSLSAQTKMMIDRFQCHWRALNILRLESEVKRKSGVFLCVEATEREDFQENAKSVVKNFFASVNASYDGEVLCRGADAKGAVLRQPEVLEKAYMLGCSVAGK